MSKENEKRGITILPGMVTTCTAISMLDELSEKGKTDAIAGWGPFGATISTLHAIRI